MASLRQEGEQLQLFSLQSPSEQASPASMPRFRYENPVEFDRLLNSIAVRKQAAQDASFVVVDFEDNIHESLQKFVKELNLPKKEAIVVMPGTYHGAVMQKLDHLIYKKTILKGIDKHFNFYRSPYYRVGEDRKIAPECGIGPSWSYKPSLIFEVGASQGPSSLRDKASEWFFDAKVPVKMVLTMNLKARSMTWTLWAKDGQNMNIRAEIEITRRGAIDAEASSPLELPLCCLLEHEGGCDPLILEREDIEEVARQTWKEVSLMEQEDM